MTREVQNAIKVLETEWAKPNGFLGKVRDGIFDVQHAEKFVQMLEKIRLGTGSWVDRRLISLIWYIPIFLSWQRERVAERGGDLTQFERIVNRVQAIIEDLLGVP